MFLLPVLDVIREFPGLHVKDLERLTGTRRVYRVVRVLERAGLVRVLWIPRVFSGRFEAIRIRRVKAVFPIDTPDPGLAFLVTWIKRHSDSVYYVDVVEDGDSIIVTLHGGFTREEVLDLRYSLEFFGFRTRFRRFNRSRIHEYIVVIIPKSRDDKGVEYSG